MSNKYPCVYYDNGKCQKFSDDQYSAWCDFDQCEHITPSNGDRLRGMTDEELAELLCRVDVRKGFSDITAWADWLRKPAEEDT